MSRLDAEQSTPPVNVRENPLNCYSQQFKGNVREIWIVIRLITIVDQRHCNNAPMLSFLIGSDSDLGKRVACDWL